MVATGFRQHGLRAMIAPVLDCWHVPGLAVAVVCDGKVLLQEGYGLRNIAQGLPVTAETLFPIASCTKAFTALALGMLVDAGKLDWDRPVKAYLPAFQLWDLFATERITARDLLTHRSGLPGHDMMWYATQFNRREIFHRLRYLEPSCDLRVAFQYQNLMYMVAGLLLEEITGSSWQQFIQQRILDPLRMERTGFSTRVMQQDTDYAFPYRYDRGQVVEMPFQEMDGEQNPVAGAGGIISCARDMAQWLLFLLDGGRVDGEPLISEASFQQIFTPQIVVDDPLGRGYYGYEFSSYGLGWGMRSHRGQFLAEHDGMADGFYNLVALMPRAGVGVVALSNADAYYHPVQENLVPNIVAYTAFDSLAGLEPTDWNARMRAVYDARTLALEQVRRPSEPAGSSSAACSHPAAAYLGTYEHPGYGRVSIRSERDGLRLVMNEKLSMPLTPCCYDIFEAVFEIADQRQKIAFLTDLDGAIDRVVIAVEPRVSPIVFRRVPG